MEKQSMINIRSFFKIIHLKYEIKIFGAHYHIILIFMYTYNSGSGVTSIYLLLGEPMERVVYSLLNFLDDESKYMILIILFLFFYF